ncbi:MAG: hypothetical protein H6636_12940 [Anaerolineales bacterium]|nr:hypothetical protein [Anaerolineales bacterium]
MKMRIFLLFIAFLFLSACSTTRTNSQATSTPNYAATDTANQIGTAIAAKSTETAVKASYTPTPSPIPPTLHDAILSSVEVNELANRWSDAYLDDTENVSPEYCAIDCVSFTWEGGTNGYSMLDITMFQAGSRDEATTLLASLKADFLSGTATELEKPDLALLPEETFVFRAATDKNRTIPGLMTRHGSIVILIGLDMPDLSPEENLLFLSLYANHQIAKLLAAGY